MCISLLQSITGFMPIKLAHVIEQDIVVELGSIRNTYCYI